MAKFTDVLKIDDALRNSEGVVIPLFLANDLGVDARLVGHVAKFRGFKPFRFTIEGQRVRVLLDPRGVVDTTQRIHRLFQQRGSENVSVSRP